MDDQCACCDNDRQCIGSVCDQFSIVPWNPMSSGWYSPFRCVSSTAGRLRQSSRILVHVLKLASTIWLDWLVPLLDSSGLRNPAAGSDIPSMCVLCTSMMSPAGIRAPSATKTGESGCALGNTGNHMSGARRTKVLGHNRPWTKLVEFMR